MYDLFHQNVCYFIITNQKEYVGFISSKCMVFYNYKPRIQCNNVGPTQ